MNFRRVEPNEYYRNLRLCSDQDYWEFGLSLGSAGLRLRMGKFGKPPRVLDFCLGQDAKFHAALTLAVLKKLERLPEDCSEKEIDLLFPWAGARPDLNIHLRALLTA